MSDDDVANSRNAVQPNQISGQELTCVMGNNRPQGCTIADYFPITADACVIYSFPIQLLVILTTIQLHPKYYSLQNLISNLTIYFGIQPLISHWFAFIIAA